MDTFVRLLRAHTVLRRELQAEVLSPRGLTQTDFEALLHLSRADENRLRRIDLANLLMLTPSGVTRLLEGLQESGLVVNRQCDDDARVTWAQLTDEGRETVDCVGVSHARVLRTLFSEAMSEDEVAQLSELLGRLPGVGDASCTGSVSVSEVERVSPVRARSSSAPREHPRTDHDQQLGSGARKTA